MLPSARSIPLINMTKNQHITRLALTAALVATIGAFTTYKSYANDANEEAIKEVMKVYHKAPKGIDPVCKKASEGKASPEEIKKLVAAYKTVAGTKPPRGDEASWKQKTAKLLTAAEDMEKGRPDAVAKYKEAVNCKACHEVHKPK